jgi:uncharacterized protein YjbI with pentapeptide repeats
VADPEHVKRLRQTASLRRVPIAAVIIAAVAVLELLFAIWWWVGLPGWLMIATAIALAPPLVYGAWWLWWRLPKWQLKSLEPKIPTENPKERADVEDNFRKTAGQLIGGAAVLIGAGFALVQFLQQQQTTHSQFLQQQQAAHDLLISNQVSKGFEQLASDKIAMRLGGIYALEGVMNTSEQYYVSVLEGLCAFVRENTIGKTASKDKPATDASKDKTATDVQAALTVIGRRIKRLGAVDLASVSIPGADLRYADLSDANLRGANLSGADLSYAHLGGAKLSGADLIIADLSYAHLGSANLSGADLSGAHLSGADLIIADLTKADLGSANLSGAGLIAANLSGANLTVADLTKADLGSANLSGADLSSADLSDAKLFGANLSGANLRGRGLTQTQLDGACGDANTKPPEGLKPPKLCPPPHVP